MSGLTFEIDALFAIMKDRNVPYWTDGTKCIEPTCGNMRVMTLNITDGFFYASPRCPVCRAVHETQESRKAIGKRERAFAGVEVIAAIPDGRAVIRISGNQQLAALKALRAAMPERARLMVGTGGNALTVVTCAVEHSSAVTAALVASGIKASSIVTTQK